MDGEGVIPEAAVEAAAKAVYGGDHLDGSPHREAWLRDFRIALEAAAPQLLVGVWGEGHLAGWNDRDDDAQSGWVPSGYAVDTPNPYLPTP